SGDDQVVGEFCAQYGELLHRFAEKHLAAGVVRRVGPEDVVQSACRTFLRRARGGEFHIADGEGLWRLLCAITLTKVREQTRFHMRQKRQVAQEVALPQSDDNRRARNNEPAARQPTPAEAAEFADQFQQLLLALEPEERQLVEL